MTPKEMLTWVSILGAFGVGFSAHFGVAARAEDALKDGGHTRELLVQFMNESRDMDKQLMADAKDIRNVHATDVERMRMQTDSTRERVIVLEQSTRQILDGQQKMQQILEASTVLVPSAGRAVRQ